METDNKHFKGLGASLYGDIDDLITYLALIPNEARMVKIWERSFNQRLNVYKQEYSPLRDFKDSFDEGIKEEVFLQLEEAGRELVEVADTVRDVLEIELDQSFSQKWNTVFTVQDYDIYALRAINGKKGKTGKDLFVKLNSSQADYLFNGLRDLKFIEGKQEHFRKLFTGEGVYSYLFERMTWLEDKQTLSVLIYALKNPARKQTEMHINTPHFFKDKKDNPIKLSKWKRKFNTLYREEAIKDLIKSLPNLDEAIMDILVMNIAEIEKTTVYDS